MTEFETITLTQDGAVDFRTIAVFLFPKFHLGMWKRSIFMPLPPLPLPLPLPFHSSNTSSYPILQIGSGQSLPHP